jgi:hypothetical protein
LPHVLVAPVIAAPLVRVGLVLRGAGNAAYVLTPARMDALAMGGIVALLLRSRRATVSAAPFVVSLAVLATLLWLGGTDPLIALAHRWRPSVHVAAAVGDDRLARNDAGVVTG